MYIIKFGNVLMNDEFLYCDDVDFFWYGVICVLYDICIVLEERLIFFEIILDISC